MARLVHVIEGLHPDRGGPPVVAVSLAAAQARLGHDVGLVCEAPGSEERGVETLLRSTRGADAVRVERIPKQGLYGGLYGDLAGSVKSFHPAPDLIHLHGVWNGIVLAAARAARRLKTPYVVSSHGALHPTCMREGGTKKRAALALGWRRMLAEARRVLCLNPEEAAEANRLAKRDVATVLPNGVDVASIPTPVPTRFRAMVPALGERSYFAFLGRLDLVKGLDQLLTAFAAYRRAKGAADLVVIGPDWGARRELEKSIATQDLAGHVHLPGALYGAVKFDALAGALAFVHRPRYEGFGLAVVEALAVGTPAIIGEHCLLPVSEKDGVLIVKGDATDFAAALLRVEREPDLRAALAQRAAACVRARFDWTKIAQATLEVAGVVESE